MKLISTITLVLLAATGMEAKPDYLGMCGNKNNAVLNAISRFCNAGAVGKGLHVPSKFATVGSHSRGGHYHRPAWVRITGTTCPHKIHITKSMCESRFRKMCAHGGPHGQAQRRVRCQSWWINVKDNPFKKLKHVKGHLNSRDVEEIGDGEGGEWYTPVNVTNMYEDDE